MKQRERALVVQLLLFCALAGCAATSPSQAKDDPCSNPPLPDLENSAYTLDRQPVDTPPVMLEKVEPHYPVSARRAGIQGTVVVFTTIDETGVVTEMEITRSVPALDDAATECVRQWRFCPATIGGRTIACRIIIPVTFNIRTW